MWVTGSLYAFKLMNELVPAFSLSISQSLLLLLFLTAFRTPFESVCHLERDAYQVVSQDCWWVLLRISIVRTGKSRGGVGRRGQTRLSMLGARPLVEKESSSCTRNCCFPQSNRIVQNTSDV